MRNLFPRSVSGRIRLYSALLVGVPMLFATVVLFVFVRSTILETGERGLAEQAASHKVFIEEWFRSRSSDAKFLAETDAVRQGRMEEVRNLFVRYDDSHRDISAVVMVGPEGRTIVDTSSDVSVDVSDREYFIKARAGEAHVTDVIIGRTSGKPIIIFSHPITRMDGTFGGVVFLPAQLTSIDELMTNLWFGETGETYLLDKEGFMLTEPRYLEELKAAGRVKKSAIMQVKVDSEVMASALAGQQPDGTYDDYRGVQVIGASQWTKDGAWLIVSKMDSSEVAGPLFPFLWTILGGFVVTLLVLSPILYGLARSIQIPITNMNDVSLRMSQGEFDKSCSGVGLLDPPREISQLVETFCSMQEKVDETVKELERSAITDQLTGLPNRRFLMREGARLVDIAIRASQPCTVFMIDIDHFKTINDTHGHAAGDMVLVQMASIFRETLRSSDIVARYGGEEFTVVAPGSDLESSAILAERLRHAVAAATFNTEENPIACTISIGIAHYALDVQYGVDAYEDMLSRADEALYRAKRTGRNRVERDDGTA